MAILWWTKKIKRGTAASCDTATSRWHNGPPVKVGPKPLGLLNRFSSWTGQTRNNRDTARMGLLQSNRSIASSFGRLRPETLTTGESMISRYRCSCPEICRIRSLTARFMVEDSKHSESERKARGQRRQRPRLQLTFLPCARLAGRERDDGRADRAASRFVAEPGRRRAARPEEISHFIAAAQARAS